MQKKIIALAVAGLVSGGAFAQSNVVISGQMKLGINSVSASGATNSAQNYTSRTRVTDENSNLRFSGTEDLGKGLTAWWQVESAIGTDNNIGTTGASQTAAGNNASIGARNTALGLKGSWGSVFAGKWDVHYNSMYNVEAAGLTDGLAMSTSSLNLLYSVGGVAAAAGLTGVNTGGGRVMNVMAYDTPNWNGFAAQVKYLAGTELTTPNLGAKDSGWNLRVAYDNGPIAVAWSFLDYNHLNASVPAAGNNGQGLDYTSNRFGAAYSFPMGFKIGVIWDDTQLKSNNNPANTTAATSSKASRVAWALPMNYRTGPHNFSFTYAQAGDTDLSGGTNPNGSTKARMYMGAWEYAMSKRTSVSASYVQINNDAAGTYDFWHGANNVSGATAVGLLSPGADPRQFSVVMTHRF